MSTIEANLHELAARTARWRTQMQGLVGLEDTSGVELHGLVRRLVHLYEFVENQRTCAKDMPGSGEVSGPRWGVLLYLMAHEQMGHPVVTPTGISRFLGVSKNTISSLLRGLEEQGYVERALDPDDLRVFRIRLTAAGQELVKSAAPERFAYIDRLAAGLDHDERLQLIALLEKLQCSIIVQAEVELPARHTP